MDKNNDPALLSDETLPTNTPASFPPSDPIKIGRYRVIRLLGQGGFGRETTKKSVRLSGRVSPQLARERPPLPRTFLFTPPHREPLQFNGEFP